MKDILDLLKNFKLESVIGWLKGFFLIWFKPVAFWRSIQIKPKEELLSQAFFYLIISGAIIFVFFLSGSNGIEVVKYLAKELFISCCVVLPTLFLTGFIFAKYHINKFFVRRIFIFLIFTLLLSIPIALLATELFYELEETNFLLIHNLISGPILFLYLFIFSSYIFYKKFYICIAASILNVCFVNGILYSIFYLLITPEISGKTLAYRNLDHIQREMLETQKNRSAISSIPFRLISYRNIYNHKKIYRWENIHPMDQHLTSSLDSLKINIDHKIDTVDIGSSYLNSLNILIRNIDSIKNKCRYEMNRDALNAEVNFYKSLRLLMENPIDTTDFYINYQYSLMSDVKTSQVVDTIQVYTVLNKSRIYLNTFLKEIYKYEDRFSRANFPQNKIMKYFHFGIANLNSLKRPTAIRSIPNK